MSIGIYQIRNLINGKLYIGSAAGRGFCNRRGTHLKQLRDGRHDNSHLQYAWNKYGGSSFVFEILEECKSELCIEREQYYLDTILFASCNDKRFCQLGYNILRVAGSSLGYRHSVASHLKMRNAHLGIKLTDEQKRKIGAAHRGKHVSQETREKLSRAKKGITFSAEHKQKLSSSHMGKIGELASNVKLTERKVAEIKYKQSCGVRGAVLAREYHVSQSTISGIKGGNTWSHVQPLQKGGQ